MRNEQTWIPHRNGSSSGRSHWLFAAKSWENLVAGSLDSRLAGKCRMNFSCFIFVCRAMPCRTLSDGLISCTRLPLRIITSNSWTRNNRLAPLELDQDSSCHIVCRGIIGLFRSSKALHEREHYSIELTMSLVHNFKVSRS